MSSAILEHPEALDDDELERELTIAASTRGRLRFDRYEQLLDEALLRGVVIGPDSRDDG